MSTFKKSLAAVLVAVMVLSFCAFAAGAADATVTATVTDGSVNILTDKLGLLCDGNDASGATAFSDAGLVAFENTGFTHTDGVDAAVEATVEFVLDLGENKPIKGVFMSFFKDTNSMVDLPTSIRFEASMDGDCYYSLAGGGSVSIPADAAELKTASLKLDFSSRGFYNVRYVKATVTFKNGWFFAGELGVVEADAANALDLNAEYAYTASSVPNPGIGIFTKADGALTLSDNENGKLFKNSQIVVAEDNGDGTYTITQNMLNPYPAGHTGTVELQDNEILLAIATPGADPSDAFSACKWLLRGMNAGDIVVVGDTVVSFYPAEHDFGGDDETSDPVDETSDPVDETSEPVDETSEPADETSAAPTGDNGINAIVFAIIALVAVAGAAVVVRTRR